MQYKRLVLALAIVERLAFLVWGIYQDATMVPRFTDVDYMVFTDAARYVSQGRDEPGILGIFGSPYDRDTYRYTPLLAWMLVPTSWNLPGLFSFGKLLFSAGDLVAGDLIIRVLEHEGYSTELACIYTGAWWLLNPMVCAISARGSSEGLLGVIVMLMLCLAVKRRYFLTGLATGLGIHFKIYPMIYLPTILWNMGGPQLNPFEKCRLKYLAGTAVATLGLTGLMYGVYGDEYLRHSWLHHLIRLDHRHNFSVYSTILYYASAGQGSDGFAVEHWAFVPQLVLSAVVIPLAFARKNLARTMAVQTITFVTFNKVCTSQYFLWYIVLLPFYMPRQFPSLTRGLALWVALAAAWVVGQALWLLHAYQLEFLGESTFYPSLFRDTIVFFGINILLIVFLIQYL